MRAGDLHGGCFGSIFAYKARQRWLIKRLQNTAQTIRALRMMCAGIVRKITFVAENQRGHGSFYHAVVVVRNGLEGYVAAADDTAR